MLVRGIAGSAGSGADRVRIGCGSGEARLHDGAPLVTSRCPLISTLRPTHESRIHDGAQGRETKGCKSRGVVEKLKFLRITDTDQTTRKTASFPRLFSTVASRRVVPIYSRETNDENAKLSFQAVNVFIFSRLARSEPFQRIFYM